MDLCDNDQILAWGQVHENSPVHLLVVSPDDSYLLTCDESSRIKQWLIKDQSLLKDFGTCSDTQIHTLLITHHPLQPTCPDPKKSPVFNIFTCDDNGRLKQWSLTKKKNLQIDWPPNLLYPSSHTPNQFGTSKITQILTTHPGHFLFTWSNFQGHLRQYSIKTQTLTKDYGPTHNSP